MANKFKIGELDVTVVSDGSAMAPGPVYFPASTAETWEPHKRWLNHAGMVEFPFSCFVVRSGDRTVLIDTGLGQVNMFGNTGGTLLPELAAAGFKPEDIDTVFLTHLHVDHCGTAARLEGESYTATFPKAAYRWSNAEQSYWSTNLEASFTTPDQKAYIRAMLAAIEGQYEPADDGATIAPGITVIGTPGHTIGHAALILSSGTERAFILGDAISCPVQLEEPEWSGMGDMDKDLARASQEAVLREAEESGALLTAAHFPGLTFGRVLTGKGKRYWEAVKA